MSLWADYSFARPDLAQLKASGIVGVLRYLSPDDQNTHGKILFAPERDQILGSGLDLALNFEWYAGRCLEGGAAGSADGHTALTQARALGYPQGKTIYFSHDTGAYNWAAIDSYFSAARAALGGYYKIGAYGSFSLVQQLHAAGLIDHGWQTLAWSSGQRDPWAVLYQDGSQLLGGAVDVDQVTSTDIGSWKDGPVQDWFDMATLADLQKVVNDELVFVLPRAIGLLRDGNGNKVFNNVNSGPLVDHVGIDGEIKAVGGEVAGVKAELDQLKADVASLSLVATNGIDYTKLASAVADELYRRMAS
jgi:hypothetical protein